MGNYSVTSNPPIVAYLPGLYASQGYLADPWWQGGPLLLDTATYAANGKPKTDVVYTLTGQSYTGAVLRVVGVGPGLQGWAIGDYALMSYASDGTTTDFEGPALALGVDPTKIPPIPQNGGTRQVTWAIAVKVVPVDAQGNPYPPDTGQPPLPPLPPLTGNQTQLPSPPVYVNLPQYQYYPPPPAAALGSLTGNAITDIALLGALGQKKKRKKKIVYVQGPPPTNGQQ